MNTTEQQQTQQTVPATQAIDAVKKDITPQVLEKIDLFQKSGQLRLPPGYSPENALKAAYFVLLDTKTKNGQPVLTACTKESIANSLLKMVVWGLSPLKKQCDFIAYGDKLQCDPEYTGNIVLAKRYGGLREINANAIFKGDEFVFETDTKTGRKQVLKHTQTLENFGSKEIIGAYAVMTFMDGSAKAEIMNMSQIQQAWGQGTAKGDSMAHRNFPDQMACRTVINRACKLIIRGSDDAVLYNDVTDVEHIIDVTDIVENEIKENANAKTSLSFDHPDNELADKTGAEPLEKTPPTAEPQGNGQNPPPPAGRQAKKSGQPKMPGF